jgi:hypothetical protein
MAGDSMMIFYYFNKNLNPDYFFFRSIISLINLTKFKTRNFAVRQQR